MKNLTILLLMSTGVLFANLNNEETKKNSTTIEYRTSSAIIVDGGNDGWDDE